VIDQAVPIHNHNLHSTFGMLQHLVIQVIIVIIMVADGGTAAVNYYDTLVYGHILG